MIRFFLIYFFISVILFHLSFSYLPFNGYEYRDLNSTGICFTSQVASWNVILPKTDAVYTVCESDYILGGFDVLLSWTGFFSAKYVGLPPHTMIYFTMTIWAMDSWDANDYFIADFDGNQLAGPKIHVSNFPTNICGSQYFNDLGPIRIFGKIPHTALTLNLKMLSAFDEPTNNESFGFRDIILLFVQNPSSGSTSTLCALAPITLPDKPCSCPEGQFLLGTACTICDPACSSCFSAGANGCYQCAPEASFVNDYCVFCDGSCEMCSGPLPTQCITCKPGLFLFKGMCIPDCPPPAVQTTDGCKNYCSSPCASTDYLYWNATCFSTCSFPLQQITVQTIQKCIYPCGTGEFLYWDGSCSEECPSILTKRIELDAQYCDYPCNSTLPFLYWNGSCLATCNPPHVQVFDKGQQFCKYPCSTDEFLNYDGACLSSCDPPFLNSTVASRKYCNHPCSNASAVIYWDNTCQYSCLSPLVKVTVSSLTYCVPICTPDQYIIWNGSCINTCNAPSVIVNIYFGNRCILPCSNPLDYYYEDTGACKSTCDSYTAIVDDLYYKCETNPSAVTSGLLVDLFLVTSEDSERVSFHAVTKLLQPLRYLDVDFPPRMQTFLKNKGRNIISLKLGNKMPESVQESFTQEVIPDPFLVQSLHSSFLVNYWADLTSLWIILGMVIIIVVLKIVSKAFGWGFIYNLCKSISYVPMWNFMLVLFLVNIDDIILFSCLEFKAYQASSFANAVSLMVSIFALVLLTVIIIMALLLSVRAQSIKAQNISGNDNQAYESFLNKWENCQILFSGYQKGSFHGHLFYIYYVLRLALPMIISSSYYATPLLQTISYVLISLITVGYIAIVKPIKSTINHIQLLSYEVIILIVNCCVFFLTILDIFEVENKDINIYLGDIVILGNLLQNFLILVFLGFKFYFGMKEAILLRKEGNKKETEAWFNLLFLPIQQGGMGFENAELIQAETKTIEYNRVQNPIPSKIKNKNISGFFSERSIAETTRIESTLRETSQTDKTKFVPQDMNEEVIVFSESDAVWNPTNVNLPSFDASNATNAFPIPKIIKKSTITSTFN